MLHKRINNNDASRSKHRKDEMRYKKNSLINKILRGLMILWVLFLIFGSYKANAQPQISAVNEIRIPANKVIYYPFDGQTTAGFPNKNYEFYPTHQDNSLYSIDFVLQSNYDGVSTSAAYIYPVASGDVLWAGNISGYGNVVYISHAGSLGKEFVSLYAHMQDLPLVNTGNPVTVNTRLGIQGHTGTAVTHLHFSLMYCNNPMDALNKSASGCAPVRPEPMIGKYANEKFNWWPKNDSTHNEGIGAYTPNGNRTIASNLLSDTTAPEVGGWNSGTTEPNSPDHPLPPGKPIVFDVHFGDNQSGVGEVRLMANYRDWRLDTEGTWRMIARCRPGESSQCSGGNWRHRWNWATETKPFALTPLGIPWMTDIQKIGDENQSVCIRFDVFDLAGNLRYAPEGVKCGFNVAPGADVGQPSQNRSHLIY